MEVKLDPKKIENYYIVDGKRRLLKHWYVGEKKHAFVDEGRFKQCQCGVRVYFALNKDNKPIKVHRLANKYTSHDGFCKF